MNVSLVPEREFFSIFHSPREAYSTREFIDCNKSQAEAVRFFVGREGNSPRLGIALGYAGGQWLCPFSAPFGSMAYNKPQSIERVYDFISELVEMLKPAPLTVTLPPAFYDADMLPAIHGVLANHADKVVWNYNSHCELEEHCKLYTDLNHSARKNYNQAQSSDLVFETTLDIERVYHVLESNRVAKGRKLSMPLDRVIGTVKPCGPVDADFFQLTHGGCDVAAAMVYHVSPEVAQVVYWGDAPGYSKLRPMNYLAMGIFDYYYNQGFKIVDLGTSSTSGIPNTGLVRFKQSLGCRISLRPTFTWT